MKIVIQNSFSSFDWDDIQEQIIGAATRAIFKGKRLNKEMWKEYQINVVWKRDCKHMWE